MTRLSALLYRLRLWASPRWPALDEDTQQSIDEQVRLRSQWVRDHRPDPGMSRVIACKPPEDS